MAKMFYTIEEAAQRLGQSEQEVKGLVESGQLQEFRDRDRIMLKKEQVDLLAGDDATGSNEGSSIIGLAGSGELEPISLASSDSMSPVGLSDDDKESTGISIFDSDDLDDDPSAATQVTASPIIPEFADSGASGSGLMDLAQESDDTSIGQDILGDVYGGDSDGTSTEAGGLFETTGGSGAPISEPSVPTALVAQDVYDGKGSGLAGGLALGMILTFGFAAAVAVFGIAGLRGGLIDFAAENFMVVIGSLAGATLIFGIIGMVVGGRS